MIKKLLLSIGLLATYITACSIEVSLQKAVKVAQTQLAMSGNTSKAGLPNIALVHSSEYTDDRGGKHVAYYVFGSDNGFVIIAGDDKAFPVLGYSYEGTFDLQEAPPGLIKLLFNYKKEIKKIATDNNINPTSGIIQQWHHLEAGTNIQEKLSSVSPLLTTKWNQSPYYNMNCPDNSPAGCVVSAASQIMKYYNHPSQGTGSHSYYHNAYGTLSANFGNTTYNWSNMPDQINMGSSQTQKKAIAQLMFHVGVALDMNYSPSGSGAFSQEVPDVLETYFGYSSSANHIKRSQYSLTAWINLIKGELDQSRPVYHSGFCPNPQAGHAFVVDGYDQNDKFHLNWGWGGSQDGYFQINNLNPGSTYTFNQTQSAIIEIVPLVSNVAIKLFDNLNLSSPTIAPNQSFNITTDIANYGNTSFNGRVKVSLFDLNNSFITDFGEQIISIASFDYSTVTFSTNGLNISPGNYILGIYQKKTGFGNWALLDPDVFANPLNVTAGGINPMGLISNGNIVVSPEPVEVDEPFQIEFAVLNNSPSTFSGEISMDLYDNNNNWLDELGLTSTAIGANLSKVLVFNNPGISYDPGSYKFIMWHKPNGGTWAMIASGTYPNSIEVDVVGLTFFLYAPDNYEDNDTEVNAHFVSLAWNQNSATFFTAGSNIHDIGDKDYYRIPLASGYDYKIYTRLHDSYNSSTGGSYSNDVIFNSFDGTSWSDFYDDIEMSTINLSATVHDIDYKFMVTPFFEEYLGSYEAEVQLIRTPNNWLSISQNTSTDISIYPIPAIDQFNIESNAGGISSSEIYSLNGQLLQRTLLNPLSNKETVSVKHLPSGIYLVRLIYKEQVVNKLIIVTSP